jgi:hypothetical protein
VAGHRQEGLQAGFQGPAPRQETGAVLNHIEHPNGRCCCLQLLACIHILWTTCRGEATSWRPPARQQRLSPSTTSRPPRRRRSSRMRASARWFGWNGRSTTGGRWRAPAGDDSTAAAWLQPGRSVPPPCESRRSTGDTWYILLFLHKIQIVKHNRLRIDDALVDVDIVMTRCLMLGYILLCTHAGQASPCRTARSGASAGSGARAPGAAPGSPHHALHASARARAGPLPRPPSRRHLPLRRRQPPSLPPPARRQAVFRTRDAAGSSTAQQCEPLCPCRRRRHVVAPARQGGCCLCRDDRRPYLCRQLALLDG